MESTTTYLPTENPRKRMKKHRRDTSYGFSKPLAQQFFVLRRQAEENQDAAGVETLNAIIFGITELSQAIADGEMAFRKPVSATTHSIFCDLANSYDNPEVLKKTGMHYLVEWQLPNAALGLFKRALELGSTDKRLPMLIDIATVAVHRKNGSVKGYTAGFATFTPVTIENPEIP